MKERVSVQDRAKAPPNQHATAIPGEPATDGRAHSLWFNAPIDDQDRRPQLTRQRVVAEALAVIAQDGVQALTMRSLAARLGVVPGALYHHVGNKQQLQDLVLDGVLAEVDLDLKPALAWTEQLKVVAHRLRRVLEDHPGVAGILKTRDPLGPHSLALAEALLAPLQAAGFADRQAGLAFSPAGRLHHRLRRQRHPNRGQRTTRPRPRHQNPTPPVLPHPAPRPLPSPGRPRPTRLGRQPRPTLHRRPGHAG
jgi:AcrR family transcriptional regulator